MYQPSLRVKRHKGARLIPCLLHVDSDLRSLEVASPMDDHVVDDTPIV